MTEPSTDQPSRSSLVDRIATVVVRRRRIVIAALIAIIVALSFGLTRVEADFSPENLFVSVGEQQRTGQQFRRIFGNTDNTLLVLVEAERVLDRAVLQYVLELSAALEGTPHVDRVSSLTRLPVQRGLSVADAAEGDSVDDDEAASIARAASTSIVSGKLIARDGTATAIVVTLHASVRRIDAIERVVSAVEAELARSRPPAGVSVRLGGLPMVRAVVIRKMSADQRLLLPAAFAVCFVLLLAFFRRASAVLLPIASVGLAAAALVGAMGWLGQSIDVLNNIAPLLVVIIGISDSVHLLSRNAEEVAAGVPREAAATRTLSAMAIACFLTSFTTAIGFASLVATGTPILIGFGIAAAVGVLLAYLVTVILLPAALAAGMPAPALRIKFATSSLVRWARGRAAIVISLGAVILVAGGYAAATLPVDENVAGQFSDDDDMSAVLSLLERQFEGIRPVEFHLVANESRALFDPAVLARVGAAQTEFEADTRVLGTMSFVDLIAGATAQLERREFARDVLPDSADKVAGIASLLSTLTRAPLSTYVDEGGDNVRVTVQLADIGARDTVALVEQFAARMRTAVGDAATVRITGEGYVSSRGLAALLGDLLTSLGLAVAVMFVFLAVFFRSLRLSLLSLLPNLLPLALTLLYMTARGIPLSTATVIIFSVSFGLAVDGTIHFVARFREELDAHAGQADAVAAAIDRAAAGTGNAIAITCITLIVGFALLLSSSFVPIQLFGELVAVTVAGCLVSTLLLLPPLLAAGYKEKTDHNLP